MWLFDQSGMCGRDLQFDRVSGLENCRSKKSTSNDCWSAINIKTFLSWHYHAGIFVTRARERRKKNDCFQTTQPILVSFLFYNPTIYSERGTACLSTQVWVCGRICFLRDFPSQWSWLLTHWCGQTTADSSAAQVYGMKQESETNSQGSSRGPVPGLTFWHEFAPPVSGRLVSFVTSTSVSAKQAFSQQHAQITGHWQLSRGNLGNAPTKKVRNLCKICCGQAFTVSGVEREIVRTGKTEEQNDWMTKKKLQKMLGLSL